MALCGDKPVLVLAPKPLIWQWQDELLNLLDLPTAVWDGKQWIDENGIEHPSIGAESIRKCPRRIGIVSTGLITRRSEITDYRPIHSVGMAAQSFASGFRGNRLWHSATVPALVRRRRARSWWRN